MKTVRYCKNCYLDKTPLCPFGIDHKIRKFNSCTAYYERKQQQERDHP